MTRILWWDQIGATHEVTCEAHEDPNDVLADIKRQGGTISKVDHPAKVG